MKKYMSKGEKSLFHGLFEELKIAAMVATMEDVTATQQSNIASTDIKQVMKQKKEDLKKQTELENTSDYYIEALIEHSMWDTEACMKTPNDFTSGLKKLKYKTNNLQALKDHIQIRYRGFGWDEWKTYWSHASKSLSVPELTKVLKDLMKEEKKKKRPIPEKPKVPIPQRKEMAILGTETTHRGKLDSITIEAEYEFELKYRNDWKKQELE